MTDASHRLTTLDSGLRVATESIDSVRSVALGLWIGTGSAAEHDPEAGLSHLVEHMLFRGSSRYASLEIDQIFDGMGAELNAGTGKEATSLTTRVLDRHLETALDVMADIAWRPRFEASELEQEREIVLEEIAMYDDDPQDKVFDVLGEAIFGEHPLGRAIIGRAEVVAGAQAPALAAFHGERYVPANVVVAAAGSVDHDALVELVQRSGVERAGVTPQPPLAPPPDGQPARVRFIGKATEQYHVCLGGPGIARDDERRYALRVLDALIGGTGSSRLFQEVREKRGLAYSVYSFDALYAHAGQVGLYLGTRPDNVGRALRVVADELERLRSEDPPADEVARCKENVKGRMVLSLESTSARMSRLGSALLADLPVLSVDEVIERVEAVTAADVGALARELLAPARLSAAAIGPDEDAFRRALEPLAGIVAEAA